MNPFALILLLFLSFGSQLFADVIISNAEEIIQSVQEGKIPLVPVQLDSKYERVEKNLEVSVVNKDMLKGLFKEIKNSKFYLQYHTYVGGCESRALKIAKMLDNMSIKSIKVFVRGPRYYHGVEWPFHVASVVFMVVNNEIQAFAIDPTINDNEPIPMSRWYSAIGKKYDDPSYFTNRFVFLFKHIPLAESLHDYRLEDEGAAEGQLLFLKGLPANGKLFGIIPL